jgi:hypothetical protein
MQNTVFQETDHRVHAAPTELPTMFMEAHEIPISGSRSGTCYTVCGMVRRVLAVASFVGLLVACASPTLPLPPPMEPTVEMGSDDNHVLLVEPCGGSESNAEIDIINTNPSTSKNNGDATGFIYQANACGAWQADVWAHVGDFLQITQVVGGVPGQPLDFQVTAPQ